MKEDDPIVKPHHTDTDNGRIAITRLISQKRYRKMRLTSYILFYSWKVFW